MQKQSFNSRLRSIHVSILRQTHDWYWLWWDFNCLLHTYEWRARSKSGAQRQPRVTWSACLLSHAKHLLSHTKPKSYSLETWWETTEEISNETNVNLTLTILQLCHLWKKILQLCQETVSFTQHMQQMIFLVQGGGGSNIQALAFLGKIGYNTRMSFLMVNNIENGWLNVLKSCLIMN